MVFAYTVTAPTGKLAGCEMVAGNLILKRGTWTAGNAANGTIVTGLSYVEAFSVHNHEAVSEAPTAEANQTGAGAAQNGSIGLTAFADQVNNVGTWHAWGY